MRSFDTHNVNAYLFGRQGARLTTGVAHGINPDVFGQNDIRRIGQVIVAINHGRIELRTTRLALQRQGQGRQARNRFRRRGFRRRGKGSGGGGGGNRHDGKASQGKLHDDDVLVIVIAEKKKRIDETENDERVTCRRNFLFMTKRIGGRRR